MLLTCRNTIDFYIFSLYPATPIKFKRSSSCAIDFLEFFNVDNLLIYVFLYVLLSIQYDFLFLLHRLELSGQLLNKRGAFGLPYPVPSLRVEFCSISHLSMKLAICSSQISFFSLNEFPFIASLHEGLT